LYIVSQTFDPAKLTQNNIHNILRQFRQKSIHLNYFSIQYLSILFQVSALFLK